MADESKHYKKQVLVLLDQFVVKLDNWSESSEKKHNLGKLTVDISSPVFDHLST